MSSDRILLVLHNTLHKFTPLNLAIGDIVLTDRSFVFVQYSETGYSGAIVATGALVGGLAGGVAASMANSNKLSALRHAADERRSELYGSSLAERVERYPKSILHTADSIAELRASGASTLSVALSNGESLDFVVSPMSADLQGIINNWPTSRPPYEATSDPDGFSVGSEPPRELFRRMASGDSDATAEVYRLGQDAKYAATLFATIKSMDGPERDALLIGCTNAPEVFRQSLFTVAKKERCAGIETIKAVSILIVVAMGLSVGLIFNMRSISPLAIFGLTVLVSGVIVVPSAKKARQAKEVMNHLK